MIRNRAYKKYIKYISKLALTCLLLGFFLSLPALAGSWYVAPRIGTTIDLKSGSTNSALGGAVGYQYTSFLSSELRYTRVLGGADLNIIDLSGKIMTPSGLLRPYGVLGAGGFFVDGDSIDSVIRVGGGVALSVFGAATLGVELTYLNLGGDTNLLEPSITLGIGT